MASHMAPTTKLTVKNSFLEVVDDDMPLGRSLKRSWSADQLDTRTMSSQECLPENTLRSDARMFASDNPKVTSCDPFARQIGPSAQLPPHLTAQELKARAAADSERMLKQNKELEGYVHALKIQLEQTKEAGWDPCHPRQEPLQQMCKWDEEPEVLDCSLSPLQPEEFKKTWSKPLDKHVVSQGTRMSTADFAAELARETRRMQMVDENLQDTTSRFWHMAHMMKSHMDQVHPRPSMQRPPAKACTYSAQ